MRWFIQVDALAIVPFGTSGRPSRATKLRHPSQEVPSSYTMLCKLLVSDREETEFFSFPL